MSSFPNFLLECNPRFFQHIYTFFYFYFPTFFFSRFSKALLVNSNCVEYR